MNPFLYSQTIQSDVSCFNLRRQA